MKVNGIKMTISENQSLSHFLTTQNYDMTRIAVEHNGHIIARAAYEDVLLNDEDTLEIVRFVGGG